MTFNDLPKQQRLLIYMFYYEAESGKAITMAKNGNDIIAYGISKNKNSLANMLYTLRKKGFVTEVILRNGEVAYRLTAVGQDSAHHFINLYGNDIEVPTAKGSLQENEAADADWREQFADAVASFVNSLNSLNNPTGGNSFCNQVELLKKQVEQLKAENAEKDKKISVLNHSLRDALRRLDEKTKQAQQLEDALSKLENSLGQMAAWTHRLKNGSSN